MMVCSEMQARMREWSQGEPMPAAVSQHLRECPPCAEAWQGERQLTAAFAALRAESRRAASASPQVASVLDAAFAARRHYGLPMPERLSMRPLLALAAALLLTAAGLLWMRSRGEPEESASTAAADRPVVYTGFFPLSPAAAPFDLREASHVIRIRLPRGEMRRFGLPVQEGFERLSVEADVVIGQDGMARAVRFVQ